MSAGPPAADEAALRAWRRAGGPLRIAVRGRSMAPLLRPGDVIVVAPCEPAAARRGAILVVRQGAGLLTHRLLRAGGGALTLWGDALPRPDPPISAASLLGRAVAVERGGRRLALAGGAHDALARLLTCRLARRPARAALAAALALWEGETRHG